MHKIWSLDVSPDSKLLDFYIPPQNRSVYPWFLFEWRKKNLDFELYWYEIYYEHRKLLKREFLKEKKLKKKLFQEFNFSIQSDFEQTEPVQ